MKDRPKSLPNQFFTCMDSKVLLPKNLKQATNLVNGSVGFAKEMIYFKSKSPTSNLPIYVITDFADMCTGESFFQIIQENKGRYQSNLL